MAKYEIKIQVTGADQAAGDFKKLNDASQKTTEQFKKTGEETDKLTWKKKKLLDGLQKLGGEIPVLGSLLHALKNPFTLLGVAGVAAYSAIKKSIGEAHDEQQKWNNYAGSLSVSLAAYKNLTEATNQLTEAQKSLATQASSTNGFLQTQVDLLAENVGQQVRVLEAQKEVEAARIERDVADPVEKAKRLKENDLVFGARIGGLKGSLPGQQAQIIEKQIATEKRLQQETGSEIPTEEGLRAAVRGVQKDRAALEGAGKVNRSKSQRAELLRLASREGDDTDVLSFFNKGQIEQLAEEGVINDKLRIVPEVAAGLLPGAQAESTLSRERVARLSTSLRAGIGALPAGAAASGIFENEGLIPDFINQAQTGAAATQNASYVRQQSLEGQRSRLLRDQMNTVQIGRLDRASATIKGDTAINEAVKAATKELGREVIRGLNDVTNEIRNVNSRARSQSQQ